jgi:spore coat polysaccharide biosynthesis protein SpsF
MNNVGIIIQARMGSSRFPGKVLRKIGSLPLLGHVLGRLSNLNGSIRIIIATTTKSADDDIVDYCISNNVAYFRGSELDVLARYYNCAMENSFKQIVRLTSDNPFTDIHELKRLIRLHIQDNNDYTHSFGRLPVGVGAEIFTFNALERSYREGKLKNHREHVNEYIQEQPDVFRIGSLPIENSKVAPSLRLTVDTENDYKRACYLVDTINKDWVTTEDAIKLCLESV